MSCFQRTHRFSDQSTLLGGLSASPVSLLHLLFSLHQLLSPSMPAPLLLLLEPPLFPLYAPPSFPPCTTSSSLCSSPAVPVSAPRRWCRALPRRLRHASHAQHPQSRHRLHDPRPARQQHQHRAPPTQVAPRCVCVCACVCVCGSRRLQGVNPGLGFGATLVTAMQVRISRFCSIRGRFCNVLGERP